MRVLHLNQFGVYIGGVEGYIADVSAVLQEKGHPSHLIYFSAQEGGKLIPDSIHVPFEWPALPAGAVQAVGQAIRQFCPDVAYIHGVYHPDLIEWVSRRLPTLAYVHSPYPVCPGSAQFWRRSERACPRRPGLACLWYAQRERCCWGRSPKLHARFLRRVYQFREAYQTVERILVAGTFMRQLLGRAGWPLAKLDTLAPILLADDAFAASADPYPNRILYAGRLVQEKGLGYLLNALAQVRADWQLVVAGDGPARASFEALACQLNIAHRVQFCGWLSPVEMKLAVSQSAFVAIPSLWPEPFGRLGPEAFVCARPAVAFATGGVVDWIEHQVTGLLVAQGDVRGLAQSLLLLLQDSRLCRQMGQRAREYAWLHWRRTGHVDLLLGHLESVQSSFASMGAS